MNIGGFVVLSIIIGYLGINTIVNGIRNFLNGKDKDKDED